MEPGDIILVEKEKKINIIKLLIHHKLYTGTDFPFVPAL